MPKAKKTSQSVARLDPKALVVQSNELVRARYSLGIYELKLLKILISMIDENDKHFQEYELSAPEVARLMGIKHNDFSKQLMNITESLISKVVVFINPETKRTRQVSWLASAEYFTGEGRMTMTIAPSMKPYLLQLKASESFAYELGLVLGLKNPNAVRFFELYQEAKKNQTVKFIVAFDELKTILGIEPKRYKIFRDFRKRVLEPAKKELDEKIGDVFSWREIKRGRGGRLENIELSFQFQAEPLAANDTIEHQPDGTVVDALTEVGVSKTVAQKLALQHSAEHIAEKLEYMRAVNRKRPIANCAAFLVKAIREDWSTKEIKQHSDIQPAPAQAAKPALAERKKAYRKYCQNAIVDAFNALAKDHQTKLREQFITAARDGQERSLYVSYHQRLDALSPASEAQFRSFLKRQAPVALPTFNEYCAQQLDGDNVISTAQSTLKFVFTE